jgi:hypothetical protein
MSLRKMLNEMEDQVFEFTDVLRHNRMAQILWYGMAASLVIVTISCVMQIAGGMR